ncbi:MAG: hypothetical protein JWM80_877 [Cyanobacteria bacterium RYN_339]|nr:hypothetical protein [Cyanobacteria bacterium RYN_339]
MRRWLLALVLAGCDTPQPAVPVDAALAREPKASEVYYAGRAWIYTRNNAPLTLAVQAVSGNTVTVKVVDAAGDRTVALDLAGGAPFLGMQTLLRVPVPNDPASASVTYDLTASQTEKLTVPAGTFDTLHKSFAKTLVGATGSVDAKYEAWYNARVGLVKLVEDLKNNNTGETATTTQELKTAP